MWIELVVSAVIGYLFLTKVRTNDKSTQTDAVITEMVLQTLSDEVSDTMSCMSDDGGVILYDHF